MNSCDGVIASFPRAGRGWLCRMVEWTVRDSFGLTGELSPSALEESVDYSERRVPRLIEGFNRGEVRRNGVPASLISGTPRLIRTHDDRATLEDRIGAFPTVLVCRDPIDSLVSFFHFRRDHRKAFDGTLSESIRHPNQGPLRLARWYNTWGEAEPAHLVTFEQLKTDPEHALGSVLDFLKVQTARPLAEIVDVWSFERRQALASTASQSSGLREGRVGTGREAMSSPDQEYVFSELDKHLLPQGRRLFDQAGYGAG